MQAVQCPVQTQQPSVFSSVEGIDVLRELTYALSHVEILFFFQIGRDDCGVVERAGR